VRGDDKLLKFLNEGWDLVKELSEDKFLMQNSLDKSAPDPRWSEQITRAMIAFSLS
jgi:hypothetical protein